MSGRFIWRIFPRSICSRCFLDAAFGMGILKEKHTLTGHGRGSLSQCERSCHLTCSFSLACLSNVITLPYNNLLAGRCHGIGSPTTGIIIPTQPPVKTLHKHRQGIKQEKKNACIYMMSVVHMRNVSTKQQKGIGGRNTSRRL